MFFLLIFKKQPFISEKLSLNYDFVPLPLPSRYSFGPYITDRYRFRANVTQRYATLRIDRYQALPNVTVTCVTDLFIGCFEKRFKVL